MSKLVWLLRIWVAGYIICFVMLLLLWPLGDVHRAHLDGAIGSVTTIYSPYLLPIVTFWFVKRSSDEIGPAGEAFWIAIAVSLLFNGLMVGLIVSIHFQLAAQTVLSDTMNLASKLTGYLSFLVAPAIGYFFGKSK